MKRYKPPLQSTPEDGISSLPLDRPVAVYYRQSTEAQIGNISTTIQTVDMVDHLKKRGWSEENIILIDMDRGVSGTTKIDEREGMRALFELITDDKIGTVACQDEDRLFRDVTQIQVNIFIEACKTSNVFVLTPSMIYDFANELTGTFHARQFRFKSEMAAEYISAVIKGKLHRALDRLRMEGRWAGSAMATGYMVDMRKTLPGGLKNENWRRYVPFEPYAEVVNEYFKMFLEHGGNVYATVRHIQEHGPWYPDPAICKPPEGYKAVYHLYRYEKGYCPGRTGLLTLLTNVAYLGHWTHKDSIVRWNNHPAIVPADIFMRAFNYLSEVDLDGRRNPHYKPSRENARPSREDERDVERPLCSGLIVAWHEGEWHNVSTGWVKPCGYYAYELIPGKRLLRSHVWHKKAIYFDEAITSLLRQKLSITFDTAVWEQTLASFEEHYRMASKGKLAQIQTLERVMESQVASLDTLTNPDMIRAVQSRYEDAKVELMRLKSEVSKVDNEVKQLEAARNLKETCGPALENWPNLSRNEKRVILQAFIDRIETTYLKGKELLIAVCWRDNTRDEVILPVQSSHGVYWTQDEAKLLLDLVDKGASQVEIAAQFPTRTWKEIRNKVHYERGRGLLSFGSLTIGQNETYLQYVEKSGSSPLKDAGSEHCQVYTIVCVSAIHQFFNPMLYSHHGFHPRRRR